MPHHAYHCDVPWPSVEDLELATLGRVHWHKKQRLRGYFDDAPTR
ncbi:hypothetical protein [Microbacterium sp. NPDC076895]